METEGIIKVMGCTHWMNYLVLVEKWEGKLRIYLDLQDLNRAIQTPHCPMRTPEDTLPELTGAKLFTKIDIWYRY